MAKDEFKEQKIEKQARRFNTTNSPRFSDSEEIKSVQFPQTIDMTSADKLAVDNANFPIRMSGQQRSQAGSIPSDMGSQADLDSYIQANPMNWMTETPEQDEKQTSFLEPEGLKEAPTTADWSKVKMPEIKSDTAADDFKNLVNQYQKKSPIGKWSQKMLGLGSEPYLDSSRDAKSSGKLLRDTLGSDEKFYAFLVSKGKITATEAMQKLNIEHDKTFAQDLDFKNALNNFQDQSLLKRASTRIKAMNNGFSKYVGKATSAIQNGKQTLLRKAMGSDARYYAYLAYTGNMTTEEAMTTLKTGEEAQSVDDNLSPEQSAAAITQLHREPSVNTNTSPTKERTQNRDQSRNSGYNPNAEHEIYFTRPDGKQIAIAEEDVIRNEKGGVIGLKPESKDKYDLTGKGQTDALKATTPKQENSGAHVASSHAVAKIMEGVEAQKSTETEAPKEYISNRQAPKADPASTLKPETVPQNVKPAKPAEAPHGDKIAEDKIAFKKPESKKQHIAFRAQSHVIAGRQDNIEKRKKVVAPKKAPKRTI